MRLLTLALSGCLVSPKATTDSTLTTNASVLTSDTTEPPLSEACEDVNALGRVLCVGTTAPLEPLAEPGYSGTPPPPLVYTGSGVVSEVSTPDDPLGSLPGSVPEGFRACTPQFNTQVRVLDSDGYTWAFGWELPETMESEHAIEVGAALDFTVSYIPERFEAHAGVLLADERGPLFLYEESRIFSMEERGGLWFEFDAQNTCQLGYGVHDLATVHWEGGSAELRSGGSLTVPVQPGPRELVFLLLAAYVYVESDCFIGCDHYAWMAWAKP